MKNPTTIEEACNCIAKLIKKIAKETNQEGLYGEVHIEGDNWPYDSCVELTIGLPNGGKHHTGYSISPMIEQRAMGQFQQGQDFIQYYIQHEEITRGVRYYPDGSGEPDSSDLVDDFTTDNPYEAATKVVLLYLELCINQMFDAESEEEMYKECLVDSDGCLIDNDGDAETDMET